MKAWLGLGGNLGDPERAFVIALETLEAEGDRVEAVASLWRTEAIGPPGQPDHLNTVVRLDTARTPRELLVRLKQLERAAGRQAGMAWGPRPLDMDLLLLADDRAAWITVQEPGLGVPHARMGERAFVLCPLTELEPDVCDPRDGRPLVELAASEVIRAQRVEQLTRKEAWYPVPIVR